MKTENEDLCEAIARLIKEISAQLDEQSAEISHLRGLLNNRSPSVKKRTIPQNRLLWAGMLGDFAEQGQINGRKFNAATWHHFLKEEFLPNQPEEGITSDDYEKWTEAPFGRLILTGSTTKLTTKGFSDYMEKCFAFGCTDLGIRFTEVRNFN